MLTAPQSYNEKSDVYSFGVILWELFMGQEPWQDKNAMQVTVSIQLWQAAWRSMLASWPLWQCLVVHLGRTSLPGY